jgi:hypothetical protein
MLNSSQLAFVVEDFIHISNGSYFSVDKKYMKEVQETFAAQATLATHSTPEQFKKFVAAEIKMWGDVVRMTGASAS